MSDKMCGDDTRSLLLIMSNTPNSENGYNPLFIYKCYVSELIAFIKKHIIQLLNGI